MGETQTRLTRTRSTALVRRRRKNHTEADEKPQNLTTSVGDCPNSRAQRNVKDMDRRVRWRGAKWKGRKSGIRVTERCTDKFRA